MRPLNLKDTFSWTRIWSCPRVKKSLQGRVVHHISSTIIHPQFILGAIPGLSSLMVSYQSLLFFTGIIFQRKTSKSPEWFHLTIAKLQSCLYVANLQKLGGCLDHKNPALIHSSVQVMSSLKEVRLKHNQNCHRHGVFFVLLLESNYIAETEIIAERVFFFSTRDTPSLWSILGDLSICLPGGSKWGADSGSFLFQRSQQLENEKLGLIHWPVSSRPDSSRNIEAFERSHLYGCFQK